MTTWTPSSIKGINGGVPVAPDKQSPGGIYGVSIVDTGQENTLVNQRKTPGDFGFLDLDSIYFSQSNIIMNGDFSDATVSDTASGPLPGWSGSALTSGLAGGGTHTASNHFTISSVSGSNKLSIIRGGPGDFFIYQTVLCRAGTYTYSVDIHTIGPGFQILDYDFDVGGHVAVQFPPSGGSGIKTGTFTVLRNSTNLILISRQSNEDDSDDGFGTDHTYATGTTIIDDISITPIISHIPDGADDTDGTFDTTIKSQWFRDDGNTTT